MWFTWHLVFRNAGIPIGYNTMGAFGFECSCYVIQYRFGWCWTCMVVLGYIKCIDFLALCSFCAVDCDIVQHAAIYTTAECPNTNAAISHFHWKWPSISQPMQCKFIFLFTCTFSSCVLAFKPIASIVFRRNICTPHTNERWKIKMETSMITTVLFETIP